MTPTQTEVIEAPQDAPTTDNDQPLGKQMVPGRELHVGDVIEVWWQPGRDVITALAPYTGPIQELTGARIAEFATFTTGMTIEPRAGYTRIASTTPNNA